MKRVHLEALQRDHLAAVFLLKNNPNVLAWIPGDYPLDRAQFERKSSAVIAHGVSLRRGQFSVLVDGEIAGQIGYFYRDEGPRAELGFFIAEAWWGLGVATTAVKLCLDKMRDIGMTGAIEAVHEAKNVGSGRVLEKNGFEFDADVTLTLFDGDTVQGRRWLITL